MDAVAPAHRHRVFVLNCAPLERREQRIEISKQDIGSARKLDGKARIEHVRRGHALMHIARLRSGMLSNARQKGDNVVFHFALDLVDARYIKRPALAQSP